MAGFVTVGLGGLVLDQAGRAIRGRLALHNFGLVVMVVGLVLASSPLVGRETAIRPGLWTALAGAVLLAGAAGWWAWPERPVRSSGRDRDAPLRLDR